MSHPLAKLELNECPPLIWEYFWRGTIRALSQTKQIRRQFSISDGEFDDHDAMGIPERKVDMMTRLSSFEDEGI